MKGVTEATPKSYFLLSMNCGITTEERFIFL